MPTQKEYNVSLQQDRTIYAKIYLLNFKFQEVGELSGVVLDGATFTNDSTSDIRRTCSISLIPTDSTFDIEYGSKIWIDKCVKIYIGISDIHNADEIIYTNMGIYLINNPNQNYNATNNTLTINGIDMMAKLTGLRNGNLDGIEYVVKANSDIRGAMISALNVAGITKYAIDVPSPTSKVPNDISISIGGTVYDLLNQLATINSNYQMYFDVDGVFRYNLIPSGKNERVYADDELWNKNLISYTKNISFENVKNVIEVFGKTHEIDNYGKLENKSTYYNLPLSKLESLEDGIEIGFTTPNTLYNGNPKIKIQYASGGSSSTYYLKRYDGTYPTLKKNTYYTARFYNDGSSTPYFLFLGGLTPYGIAKDTNSDSPFYINGTAGVIRIVLSSGEYDNIYSDDLAQQRANYELYTRCRLQDSVSISCVPIYWLDANWLIELTLPNKQGNEETNKYLIKSINTTLGVNGTQTINLMKYYPYYDF